MHRSYTHNNIAHIHTFIYIAICRWIRCRMLAITSQLFVFGAWLDAWHILPKLSSGSLLDKRRHVTRRVASVNTNSICSLCEREWSSDWHPWKCSALYSSASPTICLTILYLSCHQSKQRICRCGVCKIIYIYRLRYIV